MSSVRLHLFGPPRLEIDGNSVTLPLRKSLALLAYLALCDESVPRESLATLLWPDRDERSARANLRRAIYEIGKRIPLSLLRLDGDHVALDPSLELQVDVRRFRTIVESMKSGEFEDAALEEAAALYSADFLEGFSLPDADPFEEWRFFEAEGLRHALESLLLHLVESYRLNDKLSSAVDGARRLLGLDPLDESRHRRLMTLYAQTGQRGAALRQYESCARLLKEELGVEPSAETLDLYRSIRTGSLTNALRKNPSTPPRQSEPHTTSTPFVGRREEMGAVMRRLMDPTCRLLTLIGPGGIGKTRLALEVVRRAQANELPNGFQFRDGCYFVPLQPVEDPAHLPAEIADVLGLRLFEERSSRRQLMDYLRDRQMLLVLDNFEQLIEGVDLLGEIVTQTDGIKLLVTSRDAIRLREAWFHPIAGMAFPKSSPHEHEPLDAYDAVRFFVHCARRARVGFSLVDERDPVVRICRLVEGMPLALELSATWLRALSTEDVATEIESGLDILRARDENVPERHRSIRVVFNQSWKRLRSDEQTILYNLSLFRGGCDGEAAREVALAPMLQLSSLVDRALLRRTESGRYEIHELLRQFLAETMPPASRDVGFKRRYVQFFLERLCRRGGMLYGSQPQDTVRRLRLDLENYRQAWFWGLDLGAWSLVEAAGDHLAALHNFTGLFQEGSRLFSESLLRLEKAQEREGAGRVLVETYLRIYHAHFLSIAGNLSRAMEEIEAATSLAKESGDEGALARASLTHTSIVDLMGRSAEMVTHAQETLRLARRAGDRRLQAEALNMLSWAYYHIQDPEQALESALRAARLFEETDNRFGLAQSTGYTARAYCLQGNYEKGLEYDRRAYALFEEMGNTLYVAYTLSNIGLTNYYSGRLDEALDSSYRALELLESLGYRAQQANSLENIGDILAAMGDFGAAEAAFRRALVLCHETGAGLVECGVRCRLGRLLSDQGRDDEALEMLEEALQQARRIPDKYLAALAEGEQGRLFLRQGDYDRADACLQGAIPPLRRLSPFDAVPVLLARARLYIDRWRLKDARSLLHEVQSLDVHAGRRTEIFEARLLLVQIQIREGSEESAHGELQRLEVEARNPVERAAWLYACWRLSGDEDMRTRAATIYTRLLEKSPAVNFQDRLRHLEKSTC